MLIDNVITLFVNSRFTRMSPKATLVVIKSQLNLVLVDSTN